MATYFILAYALSWLVVVPTEGTLLPWGPLPGLSPNEFAKRLWLW